MGVVLSVMKLEDDILVRFITIKGLLGLHVQ